MTDKEKIEYLKATIEFMVMMGATKGDDELREMSQEIIDKRNPEEQEAILHRLADTGGDAIRAALAL